MKESLLSSNKPIFPATTLAINLQLSYYDAVAVTRDKMEEPNSNEPFQ